MSGGGEEFETPPASPSYSPQPSDSEEDEEDMDVANDVPDEIGWWENEEIVQKERERFERCIYLADKAHIELIHALPWDMRPTLETVLQYAEYVSLGCWHLLEVDQHFYERIVENFLVSGGIN